MSEEVVVALPGPRQSKPVYQDDVTMRQLWLMRRFVSEDLVMALPSLRKFNPTIRKGDCVLFKPSYPRAFSTSILAVSDNRFSIRHLLNFKIRLTWKSGQRRSRET